MLASRVSADWGNGPSTSQLWGARFSGSGKLGALGAADACAAVSALAGGGTLAGAQAAVAAAKSAATRQESGARRSGGFWSVASGIAVAFLVRATLGCRAGH